MTVAEFDPDDAPMLLAGRPRKGRPVVISCPHDGAAVGRAHVGGAAELESAIAAAAAAAPATRRLPAHERAAILRRVADGLEADAEAGARLLALEAGKPIRQARVEVARAVITFRTAAGEAERPAGEWLALDGVPGGEGRSGLLRRVPVGPIAAITPFNFPLNLVAHKVAPAIAAGCPVVLKPAPQTPLSALRLGALIVAAGWPAGALSVLPLDVADAGPLVDDPRLRLLSFTGSPGVGWALKARAPRKRVTLELGGNAGVIIHDDADLEQAAERCVAGGFAYAGQTCISVQRIFVQAAGYDAFLAALLPRVRALRLEPPLSETADLSSLINDVEASRVAEWMAEARAAGARVLCGGSLEGRCMIPTVVADAAPGLRIQCAEVFAPLVTVQPYETFAAALAAVNDTPYGLQAGVFTRDIGRIFQAADALEVGALLINEVPTWRLDPMPYGGVKESGVGREGVRYAIEEMTEPRLLVLPTGSG